MIFRITVNDNDFTEVLEKFADNLFDRVYWAKDKPEEMSATEWYEKLYKPKQEIQKLMNPNITSSLTKEDKVLLRAAVFLEWCDYLDSLPVDDEMDAETKEYLKKNFIVSVSFRFTDKWENGEVVYYFTTNQKWISQFVCGHWHTSYGHSRLENKGSEFDSDADFSPFQGKNIIAIDACTAHSGLVNCLVIED